MNQRLDCRRSMLRGVDDGGSWEFFFSRWYFHNQDHNLPELAGNLHSFSFKAEKDESPPLLLGSFRLDPLIDRVRALELNDGTSLRRFGLYRKNIVERLFENLTSTQKVESCSTSLSVHHFNQIPKWKPEWWNYIFLSERNYLTSIQL